MNDAEFLAEAKKGNLDIGPVAGEDLEKIANSSFKEQMAIKSPRPRTRNCQKNRTA
jgi:hypothetical protein